MKRDVMEKWVAALRSGKYQQGIGLLQHGNTYCCLGVLCAIAPHELVRRNINGIAGTSLGSQPEVQVWAKITTAIGHVPAFGHRDELCPIGLVHLNDDDKKTFAEIADIIEANWEDL